MTCNVHERIRLDDVAAVDDLRSGSIERMQQRILECLARNTNVKRRRVQDDVALRGQQLKVRLEAGVRHVDAVAGRCGVHDRREKSERLQRLNTAAQQIPAQRQRVALRRST